MRPLAWIVLAVTSNVAAADTIKGDKAERLTYALRYANAPVQTAKGARTFSIGTATCIKTIDPGGGMPDFACTMESKPVKDAAAYLLYAALNDVGFTQTAVGDTKIKVSADAVACTLDPSKPFGERFSCFNDSFHPDDSDNKTTIHPVKIEKQH